MKRYRNPWARQLPARERAYFAENEAEMAGAVLEADYAEGRDTKTCGVCGAEAFYKPTVGTHICPDCGALWKRDHWLER
jgi:hypothetical protein